MERGIMAMKRGIMAMERGIMAMGVCVLFLIFNIGWVV